MALRTIGVATRMRGRGGQWRLLRRYLLLNFIASVLPQDTSSSGLQKVTSPFCNIVRYCRLETQGKWSLLGNHGLCYSNQSHGDHYTFHLPSLHLTRKAVSFLEGREQEESGRGHRHTTFWRLQVEYSNYCLKYKCLLGLQCFHFVPQPGYFSLQFTSKKKNRKRRKVGLFVELLGIAINLLQLTHLLAVSFSSFPSS